MNKQKTKHVVCITLSLLLLFGSIGYAFDAEAQLIPMKCDATSGTVVDNDLVANDNQQLMSSLRGGWSEGQMGVIALALATCAIIVIVAYASTDSK